MTQSLVPAVTLAAKASQPYPNDSADYRRARTALLAEEIELRRHIERVAAQRRALPPGGAVTRDYRFVNENGREVGLAALFGKHETLVTYLWMFGPSRAKYCSASMRTAVGVSGVRSFATSAAAAASRQSASARTASAATSSDASESAATVPLTTEADGTYGFSSSALVCANVAPPSSAAAARCWMRWRVFMG